MVGVSVVQVGSAVRHTPLAPLSHETEPILNSEDPNKSLRNGSCQFPVLGGFVGGGQLAWRAFGPTVEVIEPSTGTRKAAWTFGAILHNAGARVTSVCGVGPGTISQVIVGVDLGADRKPQGMVALMCLYSSRLTRVFHFTHKVTSLCMVSGGEVSVDSGTLAPELRPWHGLLVVGTAHGTLHLLDLALDLGGHKVLSDEVSPGNLISVVTPDPQADRTRISAVMQHCHPTMCLSDSMSYGGRFHLIGPDDNILFETSSHLVTTTALAFIPQLASLIVGYNFGAFQIINLSSLTIDCTSPYEDKMPPVYSFACQEPENDPKNFVYLWLCRSWGPADGGRESKTGRENNSHALCTMYAMNYDNKVWIEGHGLWYQGLASISPRFEFDAIGGLGLKGQPAKPSVVFAAMTVRQTTPNSAATPGGSSSVSALATPDEDSGPVPEQSLCLFGWVGGILEHGRISVNHYLAVFDINQWYQAQMPSTMKLEENHLCPYMSFHELDRVPGDNISEGLSEIVLGAAPKPVSWARHMSRTCNDSDWFPAALSYDAHVLTSEGLMEYRCQSAQQAALTHLTSCGPSAIVSPEDAYAMCVFAGLIPPDAHPTTTGSYMVIEREALLNVALDQQLVSLLVQCVAEFSEGRFTNLGCSLPSLLEWSWSRVCTIKTTNDNLCLPLFDPDCGVMSAESIAVLHQNLTSLASLTTIITAIRDYANTNMITLQGAGELENRVQVVGLLMLHLSVVLWFYHCGLLSHTPTEDVIEDCHVPFPADLLCRIYKNRRSEIQRLSSALVGNEVLMIDGLLEDTTDSCECIGKAWEKEGGSGMYPPPSLHALLAIFLLPDVSTTTKHRIVQYLFLDLASLLSDGYVRVVEELVKYPSSFSLSPSHIKLTQAFWLLDHKDFQEGLNVLLDPLVNTNDITPWQHRRIMKAFLYQGEHSRALTYAQIRQPPKVDLDDVRLHLTLLLANGLIREAFHYQRSHRNKNNSEDLLNHLFTGCEQLGKLESVVHLPLSPFEEEALVSYLHASSNPSAHDYLLVYYLQRARYDDAAVLQDSLRSLGTAKKRQGARSALVHGYLTHLPDVAKRLTSGAIGKNGPTHSIYTKPQPLSAQIRQAVSSPVSHAAGINRMLEQSQEAWPSKWGSTTPYTPFRNKSQRRKALEPIESEDFVGLFTPKRKNLTSGETSHVVFPSRVQASYSKYTEEEDGEVGLFSPAAKRSRLGESSHMRDDVSKLMESVLRKSVYGGIDADASISKNISSDLMSLLQTPKIMRKRKSGTHPSTESSLVDTPQSILKVRQMVQRPLSPSPASETSIPVFPRLSSKKASISTAEDLLPSRASDTSMTPKQLRFHLPKMRMDEDPVINEQGEEKEEIMHDDDHYVPEEVVAEKNVEEEIVIIEHEDVQELGVEVENEEKGDRIKKSEIVQDIEGSEEECGQELEDEGVTELEEEEKERERDLVQKAVIIPPDPDTHNHSENPLKNPDSGIPTPRQPLHGCVAKRASVAAVLHQSDFEECIDEVDTKEAQEEEQEESLECISRDTTINEIYYSFTEEEPSKEGEAEDKYITEDEDEELEGAERSKEVGDSDDDFALQDDENEKEGEKEIIYIDEFCPKGEQYDKTKSQKEEDLHYEGLYDDMDEGGSEEAEEVETTNAINQETKKDMDEGGSEEAEEVETTNAINQETKKVCESFSLLEGQTLDSSNEKVDHLSSSEDSVDEGGSEEAEEVETTNAINQETKKDMDEGGSEKAEEVETTNAIDQETKKVCESFSLLEGQTLDSSNEKVDHLSSSEDSVEETEHIVEEVTDLISNSADTETERNNEDKSELSLNDSEVIKVLEFSESEPEESDVKEKLPSKEKEYVKEKDTGKIEQQMKEMADNVSGSPGSETEEKCEDELKLSLNESEIISPLEFSESESEPEESSLVKEKQTFKGIEDQAREEEDAADELTAKDQQPAMEKLVISSKEEDSAAKEGELATKEEQQEVTTATEETTSEENTSTIEKEEPTTKELESATKDKVTTEEQQLTTKEDLGKERESVIMKEAPFTEGSSATVEEELPVMGKHQHHPVRDDHNEGKERLVEKTENFMADLSENNRELILEADCQITEEEQEMITEAISEEESICLSLETPEHFSPLRFSDSENEDEDKLEEIPEEKGKLKNEVEHISSSETKSPPTEVTLPLNENQDIKMPESSIFEKKIMKVNNSEEQSIEASISEGRGDVADVTKMEHEAAVLVGETPAAVVPRQCENSRVTKTEEVLISLDELQGNKTSGFEMTDATVEVATTTVMNKEYLSNLKDQRVESGVAEEKLSKPSVPEDIEAFRLEKKIIDRSQEVDEASKNISCVKKFEETISITKENTVIKASGFRIAHEIQTIQTTEDFKSVSSEEDSHISNDEETSMKANEIRASSLTVKMDSGEMLPLEDQTTKSLGNEDMSEKLCVNKSSDEKILLRNYDNERGVLEREGTEVVLPETDNEYMGVMETNNSYTEVLKNRGHDKESFRSQEENVGLKTENAGLEKKMFEFEGQVLSKTSSKDEKEESASLQIESMEQEASTMTKEQKDELTATPQEKSARSTPISEETIVSVSPRSARWRESAGSSTEVSEEVPLSVSPRKCSKQIDSLETATTVIEESASTMSPKSSEYDADRDIPTETTKETTLTGPLTKFNEEATLTVSTRRSSGCSGTEVTFTAAAEETAVTVSPRRRSEQSDATDMATMSAEETFVTATASGNSRLSDATAAAATIEAESVTTETATTASLRKISKGDFANTGTKTERQETIAVSPQQNAKSPLLDTPNKSVEDTSLMTSQMKSLRHTHTSDLQTTSEEDTAKVPDASKATPLRRSQRVRASSPYTPGTPKKTRKTISSTEATTPVRASSQEPVDEMITRSGRKIRLVPTPVTKSKSSAPGSPLVTPRKSARDSEITEDMQRVSQKLELSSGIAKQSASSLILEHNSLVSQSTHDVLATPPVSPTIPSNRKQHTQITSETSRLSKRRSTRQSTSDEGLETIKEEGEKATSPKASENEGKDALHVTTAKTPTKMTPSKQSSPKVTPRRRRRSSRQSMISEGLETIAEDTEISSIANQVITEKDQTLTPSHRTRHSVAVEVAADLQRSKTSQRRQQSIGDIAETPEKKTPRRRRRSIAGDIAETPEKKTPRRRWHSFTEDATEDVEQRETPRKKEDSPLGSVFYEVENKTPSSKGQSTLPVTDVRRSARRQRQLSQSEDSRTEVEESEVTSLKTSILPSLEVLETTPSRRTTRSSGSSTVTSMKDSESSEDDNRVQKRRLSRRRSGGSTMLHSLVEEQVSRRRKSRRLTLSSTLSMTGQLQLQEPSGKPSQKYLKSLKIHSESDETASLLTPDSDYRGHSHKPRKSRVGSKSILLIEGPNEDEDLVLEHGLDTSRDADDEAKHAEVQESPDLPLNLIEVVGKGKKRRKGSLSHLSVGQGGRRRTVLPRRSLQSLKIHTESSQDQEDVVQTTTRRSQRYKRRSTNTSVLGMQIEEKNQEVEIRTPEKEVEEENVNVMKEEGGKGATALVTEVKECKDKNVEEKLVMIEGEAAVEQEEKKAEESTMESLTPQFEFAKPKSVTSSRRVRALEYLTSEAVEFLFSPPQAAGRIVRHHAKVEEGAKTSSSESEAESETGKRSPIKRQK